MVLFNSAAVQDIDYMSPSLFFCKEALSQSLIQEWKKSAPQKTLPTIVNRVQLAQHGYKHEDWYLQERLKRVHSRCGLKVFRFQFIPPSKTKLQSAVDGKPLQPGLLARIYAELWPVRHRGLHTENNMFATGSILLFMQPKPKPKTTRSSLPETASDKKRKSEESTNEPKEKKDKKQDVKKQLKRRKSTQN